MKIRPTQRPFISVICPTYNRRNFLPYLIYQFNYQTYPQQYMELIILDDSETSNKDIIPEQKNIKYIHSEKLLFLGEKRNMLNELAKNSDFIICFDDDDYHCNERVSYSVDKLLKNPTYLIAGCSDINIFYTREKKLFHIPSIHKNHAINSSFIYNVKYLEKHSYQDNKIMGEESSFTNCFSEPLLHLEPSKVFVLIAHSANTVDKYNNKLLAKEVNIKINKFFKKNDLKMLSWLDYLGKMDFKKIMVSVICPTFNRRKFLPYLIHQFNSQTWPQETMELIILDDSDVSNADIIPSQDNIKYVYSNERILLGKKRNLLNRLTKGKYIVCFDDDDFYSMERVEHAVTTLLNTTALIAGCTIMNVYYPKYDKFLTFGPYNNNHGTNATFAYAREYICEHYYQNEKTMGEEAFFTNNFSVPLIQLEPRKTMICLAHNDNTVEKDKFISVGKAQDIPYDNFFYTNDKYMLDWINELKTTI